MITKEQWDNMFDKSLHAATRGDLDRAIEMFQIVIEFDKKYNLSGIDWTTNTEAVV